MSADRFDAFTVGGALFVVSLVSSFFAYAAIGAQDGSPDSAWAEAVSRNAEWAALSGYLHAVAGFSLGAFFLCARLDRVPTWGRLMGLGWASTFVLGGIVIYASVELAGYQAHPPGAKTALVLGHLLYANPIAALLASGSILAVARSWPMQRRNWFRNFSWLAGGLGAIATLLGAVAGIGLIAMGPVALWVIVAAGVMPLTGIARPKAPDPAERQK